jgi:hypothetical protein
VSDRVIGIGVVSKRAAPDGLLDVGERFGLPNLPGKPVVLHSNLTDPRGKEVLRQLMQALGSKTEAQAAANQDAA